ncbi:hypothetical protein BJY52DRAFT_895874 [Lactarius psammicola]|nr:hypothetical protein BJY52DRAFT_895874 [Lactarius psammicola]
MSFPLRRFLRCTVFLWICSLFCYILLSTCRARSHDVTHELDLTCFPRSPHAATRPLTTDLHALPIPHVYSPSRTF